MRILEYLKEKFSKFKMKKFEIELKSLEDSSKLENYIEQAIIDYPEKEILIYYKSFSILKDSDMKLAVKYGLKYFNLKKNDIEFANVLITRLQRLGKYELTLQIAKEALIYSDNERLENIVLQDKMKKDIEKFVNCYQKNNLEKCLKLLLNIESKYKRKSNQVYWIISKVLKDKDYKLSESYAQKALSIKEDEYIRKDLYDLHILYGNLNKAREVLINKTSMETLKSKKNNIESFLDLYYNGFDFTFENMSEDYQYSSSKVFYLLHNRLPYNSGGYATRSHGLLTGVSEFGWKMEGVSRLGYPNDKLSPQVVQPVDIIDGIKYHLLEKDNIGLGQLPIKEYLIEYAQALLELAKQEKPQYIHAASNYMNGVVGNCVAKALGIKSIYEVRGLWEITRISRQPEWKDTEYYNLMVKMEAEAANGADIVIAITQALKDEMVQRGVPADKIHLLPNGVVSERFQPLVKNQELIKKLKIKNKIVIGFIGSFAQYEGLEYIVDAIEILVKRQNTNIVALMVGDGAVWQDTVNKVREKGLEKYFIFTGRIPHEEVEEYYSIVDIAPLPRKGLPVCEMVSPLKPFEAMAMEKVVLASNVAALEEIIQDGYNGMLFEKDNAKDLADKIEFLSSNQELRKKIGKQAREWVIKERDWKIITNKLNNIYLSLSDDCEI